MIPQAVGAGMFPEAGGMAAGVAATEEAATAGTMADGNRPGNGRRGSSVRRADPFEPRTIYVQPN
jgi:hypothetical protein